MNLIQFPFERVVEINLLILKTELGHKGVIDIAKLQGALGRIDNAIVYEDLNDIFEIAAKYAASIADAIRDLVIGEIDEADFADILYSQFTKDHQNS